MIRRALATYASSTTDADDLIQRYAPLIDRAARRIAVRTGLRSAFDDLWSAGALGLLEAAPRFDAARGVSFETFVEHRIRGAMLDELRKMDHLPRRLRSRTDDVQKVKQKLAAQLGRDATTEEVAQAMNVDLEELSGLEALLEPHVSLDKAAHHVSLARGTKGGAGFLRLLDRDQPVDDLAARDQEAMHFEVDAVDLLAQRAERVDGGVGHGGLLGEGFFARLS